MLELNSYLKGSHMDSFKLGLTSKKNDKGIIKYSFYYLPFSVYTQKEAGSFRIWTNRFRNIMATMTFCLYSLLISYNDFFDWIMLAISIYMITSLITVECMKHKISEKIKSV